MKFLINKLLIIFATLKNLPKRLSLLFERLCRWLRYKHHSSTHSKRLRKSILPYTHCKNCGHELKGMYCHACGQFARDINPTIVQFIWQYLENAFQFDGRAWTTMRRLFANPGRLSSEFMAGHIRRYVFPLKLYMATAVIFSFVILAVNHYEKDQSKNEAQTTIMAAQDSVFYHQIINGKQLDSTTTARLKEVLHPSKDKRQQEKLENIISASAINFAGRLPIIMMFAMPMFALLSMIFYRKKYKKYLPHLIFSIHVHTLFFISIIIMFLLGGYFYSVFTLILLWAIFIWMIIYGYIAAKRFYGDSGGRVILKNIGLYTLYYVFCFVVLLMGFLINLAYDSWASGDGFMAPFNNGMMNH